MSLILKVTSAKNQVLETVIEHEFNENGGTIGRKSSNTWVLPDEQRHLSGNHAKIDFENGSYYILDTSTNGVFINGGENPLGNGNKEKLKDGHQLMMGTFTIEATIDKGTQESNIIPNDSLSKPSLDNSDELFSDLFDDQEGHNKSQKLEPLEQDRKTSIPASIGSDDPFFEFDDFKENKNSQLKNEKVNDQNQSELDSFFKPADINQIPDDKDPFEDLEDVVTDNKEVLDDEFFETNDDSVGIPDDWDLPISNDNKFDDLLSGFNEPASEVKKESKTSNTDINLSKSNSLKSHIPDLLSSSPADNDFSNAFLRGLGLDESRYKNELSEEQFFIAGKLFRSAIQGTIAVLQSRAEIKNEMRMDMTTIQPIQNNPIKFAIDTDEVIYKLLMENNKTNMDPQQAMDEVYDDISSHQIAIISGIQASLSYVLKRFEPKNLVVRFEEDSPIGSSIPVHRKAKLWEAFENLYSTIETEAEDDFNRLFGQEFAKAYDEQVNNLKNKKTK